MSRVTPGKHLSDAEKRKGYISKHARPPRASQQVRIVKHPKPIPPVLKDARPAGSRETVEEFLKRGGRIERIPFGVSAEPLFESMRARNDRLLTRLDEEPEFQ